MRTSTLLFALLLSASPACAQHCSQTGQRQADRAEEQFEKSVPPPVHQQRSADFAKLKDDADELVILSQSIHSGIDNVQKGMLPKDLIEKLKQLEKLSKRLRSELAP
jgi:tRNA A37 N6-isopentenylltransferase MiaA